MTPSRCRYVNSICTILLRSSSESSQGEIQATPTFLMTILTTPWCSGIHPRWWHAQEECFSWLHSGTALRADPASFQASPAVDRPRHVFQGHLEKFRQKHCRTSGRLARYRCRMELSGRYNSIAVSRTVVDPSRGLTDYLLRQFLGDHFIAYSPIFRG